MRGGAPPSSAQTAKRVRWSRSRRGPGRDESGRCAKGTSAANRVGAIADIANSTLKSGSAKHLSVASCSGAKAKRCT